MANEKKEAELTPAQLRSEIAGFDVILNNPGTSAAVKGAMEKAKAGMEAKLAELEKAGPKEKEKKEEPAAAEGKKTKKAKRTKEEIAVEKAAKAKKKEKKETKAEKKEEKKEEAKEKTETASEKKEEKKEAEKKEKKAKESRIVTIKIEKPKGSGTWVDQDFDLSKCDDDTFPFGAFGAVEARAARKRAVDNKSKSRNPAVKAAEGIETTVHQVTNLVTDKQIEDHPAKVLEAIKEGKKHLLEFVNAFKGITESASLEKLKKAVTKAMDDYLKDVEKEIKENKKKE